jgi:hypothetical protein
VGSMIRRTVEWTPSHPISMSPTALASIGKDCSHVIADLLGCNQALAVLDVQAPAGRLLVKDTVEVGALDRLAGGAVGQRLTGAALAEALAGAAAKRDPRRRKAGFENGFVRAKDAQRVDSVGCQRKKGPDTVGSTRVRLVDL